MKIINNNNNDVYNPIYLAHGLGLEPRKTVLETVMLPITSYMYKNGTVIFCIHICECEAKLLRPTNLSLS